MNRIENIYYELVADFDQRVRFNEDPIPLAWNDLVEKFHSGEFIPNSEAYPEAVMDLLRICAVVDSHVRPHNILKAYESGQDVLNRVPVGF